MSWKDDKVGQVIWSGFEDCSEVETTTSTSALKFRRSLGLHEIKAYDSEVYWLRGDHESTFDNAKADRIEPGESERIHISKEYQGGQYITIKCAAGGTCKIVKRGG